jgi:3-oxoisoapionate decarboxylase
VGEAVRKRLFQRLGIASTSFLGAVLGRRLSSETRSIMSLPPVPRAESTLQFLERCHALGASGVQTQLTGDIKQLRARAEELGMWLEAMISIRNNTPESLEQAIRTAKEAGCRVARDGLLGGRRYESFRTLADWQAWVAESRQKITMALPILEKHKFVLALENHKDWTLEEYVDLFRAYSSEYLGACIDFGNNIALLDDPMEFIEAAAPYVKATHVKDVAVRAYTDGLQLAEVPLGTGVLDLERAVRLLEAANPGLRLTLEMITRNPLEVPCLADAYWLTFPGRSGRVLARTLRFVREHGSANELPHPEDLTEAEHARIEEENIVACFRYAQQQQA